MRIFRFSLGLPIRRAFRLGFSGTAIVAAQIILFATQAHALGLGNLTVNSFLDEPLDLRVELILNPGVDNLEEVVFDLASRKEFSIAGISRPEFMDEIQFDILPENGRNWLRISSVSNMREPFLHILLRAEWGGGSLLREYTALIDPPVYRSQAPAPVMAPRIREEFSSTNYSSSATQSDLASEEAYTENQAVFAETESVPLVSESVSTAVDQYSNSSSNDYSYSGGVEPYGQESSTQPLPVDEAFGVYGPIEAGETLSGIAAQLQQVYPELGYYQTLYVLHRDNQGAFIDGNMNLLKKGEILRVDSLEDIGNVSRELAVQVFQEQQGEWQGYLSDRGRVAPTYVASDSPTNATQGRVGETNAQSTANDSIANAQDQFRIGSAEGAGQSSSGVTDDTRALQSEISGLESSLLSSQLENSELRERLELLEIQLDEVNQLIALEDPTLAVLQQGLSTATSGQNQPSDTQANTGSSSSPESEVPPSLVGVGTPPANAIIPSATNGSETDISNGRAVVDEPGVGGGNAERASSAPLLIINEQSWIDRLQGYLPEIDFQNTTTMGIIGAAIAALCALLFLRRRRAQEEFEHSMLSVAVEGAHSQFDMQSVHDGVDLDEEEPDEARPQGKDSSFLTVYNDDAATVHSDDVGSRASVQFSEDLTSNALALDIAVDDLQALDRSNSELASESLSVNKISSLDSDFNLDLAESIEHYSEMLTPDATAVGKLSVLSDLMFSEGASDLSDSPALDAEDIQTQLDLAKVYFELGDQEGAGQILKDVMDCGDPNQKKQAASILSDLNA
jgi:pilus assembly protein FimV